MFIFFDEEFNVVKPPYFASEQATCKFLPDDKRNDRDFLLKALNDARNYL